MELYYRTSEPQKLTNSGNGVSTYRFNIKQEEPLADHAREGKEPKPRYSFNKVKVSGPVTSNSIFAAVLAAYYPAGVEQKLVNEYNEAVLGMAKDDQDYENKHRAYTDFLTHRAELKAMVEADCAELGIE